MKVGDRIVITKVVAEEPRYFKVGDKATITHFDEDGDIWADFDIRSWWFDKDDMNFCVQKGFAEYKLLEE